MTRRTLRILLLEDDHEDAFLFRKRCPDFLLVHHATTVASGLAVLQETAFDACFVDYRLGSESGLDFVRAARDRHPGLPLIVITGQQIEVLGENALLAGATDFVPKDNLDSDAIDRTLRWSLIRRHVELRREYQADAALISHLMGRASSPLEASGDGEGFRRLMYVSLASPPLVPGELMLMCSRFATANARMGVTGVLIYSDRRFLQIIEGSASAIEYLLQKIQADPRHSQIQIIVDEPALGRLFGEWHMGLIRTPEVNGSASRKDEIAMVAARIRLLLGESLTRGGIEQLLRNFQNGG